jgi:hypothetical protein
MSVCELHKIGLKGSRFLYSNAALFAWKNVYRRLVEMQTKQQGRNGTPLAIIKVRNHYTEMFYFKERDQLRFV